ncbi:hypothetical protein AVEN_11718-1 [Araneus ventricosus]|uniref:Uncharacterized protein n=1 Tax=Araneus ventricosus TaxID=182803 RepID=A0A4Y2IFQ6_ARAVE|nr:hypothetical protein AVEN_11718-1 [Araneus ventricosus]
MTRTTLELAPPLLTSASHQQEVILPPVFHSACTGPAYTGDLRWNRVSSLESSGPEAEALPLGHRCPFIYVRLYVVELSFSYGHRLIGRQTSHRLISCKI